MSSLSMFRFTVIGLLLANIFTTIYFSNNATNYNCGKKGADQNQRIQTASSFPQGLDETVITEIFFSVSKPYSAKKFEELLILLDPEMVASIGKENIKEEFNKIYAIFGPITEGFFSRVYPVSSTDKKLYKLDYDIGLTPGSKIGKKATLSITVQLENGKHQIKGIFLNAPTHQKE